MAQQKNQDPNASKILIVDDDDDVREVLSRLVASSGYRVLKARGGQEALKTLANEKVDLILLDLMMPDMDGFATLQHMQSQPSCKSLPVIILSAKGDKESVLKALKNGAVDYVHKGTDPDELLARIEVHLTLQKWRQKAMADYGEMIKKQMQAKYRIF